MYHVYTNKIIIIIICRKFCTVNQ